MSREEERNLSEENLNPRDSGIAGSFVHDNTINESSSSEEDNPDLQVIEEENYSDSSSTENSSESEEDNNSTMAEEQPVTPSQLSALPTFDGERGKDS